MTILRSAVLAPRRGLSSGREHVEEDALRTRSGTARLLAGAATGVLALLVATGCSGGGSDTGATAAGDGGGAPPAAAASVTITEKVGPPDSYSFSPATITVASGQSLTVVNKTDEDHQLTCTPDPGIAAGSLSVAKAGSQSLSFATAGTFDCTSSHGAKLTVTVS
jgi:plastocyanin